MNLGIIATSIRYPSLRLTLCITRTVFADQERLRCFWLMQLLTYDYLRYYRVYQYIKSALLFHTIESFINLISEYLLAISSY